MDDENVLHEPEVISPRLEKMEVRILELEHQVQRLKGIIRQTLGVEING